MNTRLHIVWAGLLALLYLPAGPALLAQPAAERSFDAEALEAYRADPAYAYGPEPLPDAPTAPPRLSSFWLMIWKGAMYLGVAGLLGLLVYLILRRTLLRPSRQVGGAGSSLPELRVEDLRELPFEALIAAAEAAGDYREAVRLLFIQTLKRLDTQAWIDWRDHKTNQDYYYELYDTPLRGDFEALALSYDYVWYGQFGLSPARFTQLRARFVAFHARLPRS